MKNHDLLQSGVTRAGHSLGSPEVLFCSSLTALLPAAPAREACDLHRLGKGPSLISSTQQVGSGGGQQSPVDHPLFPALSVGMSQQVGLKV